MTGINRKPVHCVRPEFQESRSWHLCTTMHQCILGALSPNFWQNERSPCYPIHPTPLIYCWLTFLFPKLKTAMKRTRFKAVSSIQQTLTRELKTIQKEAFSRCMNDVNVVWKGVGTILSDGINKYFVSFWCGFMASVREFVGPCICNVIQPAE
jgi:hypothetical protein